MSQLDKTIEELSEAIKKDLGDIELDVTTKGYTLADAIREGSKTTEMKEGGWGDEDGSMVCALSTGWLAAKARGIL